MKLRVEDESGEHVLELTTRDGITNYKLTDENADEGELLVSEAAPGLFSILSDGRSVQVRAARHDDAIETWVNGERRRFRVSDARDKVAGNRKATAAGAQHVHAPMPGKVVKLLVKEGDVVTAGTGLIVVEAMKMQNEMKSAKDGRVARVHVAEGATVTPGDTLLVIE